MREICTSGSVRGGGGNVPTYSAAPLPDGSEMAQERTSVGEMSHGAEEGEPAGLVQSRQPGQEQAAEQRAEHAHRQQERGP